MLPEKIEKQFELEIEAIENHQGGQLSPEMAADIAQEKKEIEGICNANQEKYQHYEALFVESFGIPLSKFWKDDYGAFEMMDFIKYLMEKHPDYKEISECPQELIHVKYGPKCDEMMLAFCDDLAQLREMRTRAEGKANIGDALRGDTSESMDMDDLPPELRDMLGL